MIEITVDKTSSGEKAEKFVRKYLAEAPLGYIYKAFRKKDIKINGHWIKKDYVLAPGDVMRIYVTDEQLADFHKPRAAQKKAFPYGIAYEDAAVLIVDKPSGLLVYGDEGEKRVTLTQAVLDYLFLKDEYDPESHGFSPSPAHRLDRNTSGLVVFGKTDEALKALEELFKERTEIEKYYTALLVGDLEGSGKVDAPLRKNAESGLVSLCSLEEGGKSAITEYKVLGHYEDSTLVELKLVTGRTHQIRVHMASLSHPVVGDGKYGDYAANREIRAKYGFDRQFLHASKIVFGSLEGSLAPLSGKTVVSKLPKDLNDLLAKIAIK